MNIKQALKKKNKLVTKARQEFVKVNTYNSMEEGNERPYDSLLSLNTYIELVDELIALKAKIHKANLPVYDKIFRLSELKTVVNNLKSLNCTEGKEINRFMNSEPRILKAKINTLLKDQMVERYEEEIDKIQDELDAFNQFTQID